jgi:cyanophycinase-like exopeptidase
METLPNADNSASAPRRGRLVILGSGETAPSMVEVHRATLGAAGPGPVLLLDTPFGFQENADILTKKATTYFAESVGRTLTPLPWRARLTGVELDRALAAVRAARGVYSGPGSPTYTMRVWGDSGLAEALADVVNAGGTVTFSSAAALALGVVTLPAHEIYRGGADPHWVPGMNVLRALTGITAAVVPHWDNGAGGSHDTRFCYVGQRRMRILEQQLPAGAHLIGVDEHTALVLDLGAGTAHVVGRGGVTVRINGAEEVLPHDSVVPIDALDRPGDAIIPSPKVALEDASNTASVAALRDETDRGYAAFAAALVARDAEAAGAAILELEQAIAEASAGVGAPEAAHPRRVLRRMILELAKAAAGGMSDPRQLMEPLVKALLEQRSAARQRRDFAAADALRDGLARAGVEVRDCPAGVEWSLRQDVRV